MRTYESVTRAFRKSVRQELLSGLQECTDEQRDLFCRIWASRAKCDPGASVEDVVWHIPFGDISTAWDQVRRTLNKKK